MSSTPVFKNTILIWWCFTYVDSISIQLECIPGKAGMVIVAEIETTIGNINEYRVGCRLIRLIADQFK